MPRRRAGRKLQKVACSPQGKAVTVPAGSEITVDVLQVFVRKALEHTQYSVAPQAAEAGHPHRDPAGRKALGQNGSLSRDHFLTVQAGRRCVQQKIHREGRLVFLLGA